jgi:hypothetical protein
MKLVAAAALAFVAIPSVASADRSSLTATLGLFTPVGELGAEYTYEPRPEVEIGIGGGVAFSGFQAAVMPRARFGDDHGAITLGVGASIGNYKEEQLFCFEDDCSDTTATTVWGNGEAALELISWHGTVARFFLGAGRIMSASSCEGPDCGSLEGDWLGYAGMSIGHLL